MYLCMYVRYNVYIRISVYFFVCMYVCMYVFMYLCMYACVFIFSLILSDPNLRVDQVGVPVRDAKVMTFPEKVSRYNIDKMRKWS